MLTVSTRTPVGVNEVLWIIHVYFLISELILGLLNSFPTHLIISILYTATHSGNIPKADQTHLLVTLLEATLGHPQADHRY